MQGLTKKSPRYLFWVLMVFVLPIVMSWVLYYYHDFFHFKTTNHGVLIKPAIAMGVVSTTPQEKTQWQIVYAPKQCVGDTYEKTTFTLHQLQAVLGQQAERVRLSVLTQKACHPTNLHGFQSIVFDAHVVAQLQQAIASSEIQDKIYLIDPRGNVFMYYGADTNPMFVLKDMKKVLEVSQIG